jgi:hypothetical protein
MTGSARESSASSPGVPDGARQMFTVAAGLILLYAVLDIVAQLLPPHYSPISQAESDLAVGPYGYVMTINFVNRGVLSLLFLVAFYWTLRAEKGPVARYSGGLVLMGIWAVGALLLAAFPTDVPATPVSWHGLIHLVVALIAFLAGAFGVLLLSVRFGESLRLALLRPYALPLGAISVLLCLIDLGLPFVAPRLAGHIGGLAERLFLGAVLLWILYVSVALARAEARKPTGSISGSPSPSSSRLPPAPAAVVPKSP